MHKEKVFTGKNIKLCLTGKVITMYDLEGNKIVSYNWLAFMEGKRYKA